MGKELSISATHGWAKHEAHHLIDYVDNLIAVVIPDKDARQAFKGELDRRFCEYITENSKQAPNNQQKKG